VTTREKAQKLLDETPDDELKPFVEILASRSKNPVRRLREYSPEEDEGPSIEQEGAAANSPERRAAIEFLRALDSGEDDGYDWSVSERLHAER
jgi:hypothetical protein